mmetsp:Transcript_44658/g.69871  ORF Transcript_44658/g.69871 Transcript_44658/m.69871 type:complete len:221 (-) Transcript_44658:129-791(-)
MNGCPHDIFHTNSIDRSPGRSTHSRYGNCCCNPLWNHQVRVASKTDTGVGILAHIVPNLPLSTASTKAAGKQLPEGVAIDKDGNPTTDPSKALEGAFLAFGGYKGAGLSLVVELLTQALSGGEIPGGDEEAHVGKGRKWRAKNWSNTCIVIDPKLMMPLARYKARVAEVCAHVKKSGPKVILPGEIEKKKRDANLKAGGITISDGLYNNIRQLAEQKSKL